MKEPQRNFQHHMPLLISIAIQQVQANRILATLLRCTTILRSNAVHGLLDLPISSSPPDLHQDPNPHIGTVVKQTELFLNTFTLCHLLLITLIPGWGLMVAELTNFQVMKKKNIIQLITPKGQEVEKGIVTDQNLSTPLRDMQYLPEIWQDIYQVKKSTEKLRDITIKANTMRVKSNGKNQVAGVNVDTHPVLKPRGSTEDLQIPGILLDKKGQGTEESKETCPELLFICTIPYT
mmetsp:Transcript_2938/g.4181  ORF Transcript_2938/g.4181 Transcript_2938/m.4181 type:complete len:235 (+) Transcript_2938:1531-2235(+)